MTGENLQAFLYDYRHYHSHWPLIHAPTFDPLSADKGLVLAMGCVGAVYSDRVGEEEARWLMGVVRTAVVRSSPVFKINQATQQPVDLMQKASGYVEEIQALVLLHSLTLWHGSQKQRQAAREEFWALANVTRRAGLMHPLPQSHPGSSSLHQPGPVTGEEVNTWNWSSWLENEKRVRLMAYTFLIDASATIFFNTQPQFDIQDIKVPLPADDAAWEAESAESCAGALGLRGQAAQIKNESGSRRAKQLGIAEALRILNGVGRCRFPERATNAFGKFGKYSYGASFTQN
jgi:hypothetical protein